VEYDEANEVRVTDWKTGKTKTGKDVEKQDDEGRLSSYMRQLAMYSYLLNNASKGNIKVSKSRLYFVEEKNSKNALYETNVTGEHIELLVKDMQDYDGQMQNGKWTERECNFKPWGSGISECPYCKMAEMYK
jgi:RecB family exonuclease